MDNQMPVMSGLDAVALLRKARRNDYVVGVTGEFLNTLVGIYYSPKIFLIGESLETDLDRFRSAGVNESVAFMILNQYKN